jgi:hypothetical protein
VIVIFRIIATPEMWVEVVNLMNALAKGFVCGELVKIVQIVKVKGGVGEGKCMYNEKSSLITSIIYPTHLIPIY